MPKILKKTLFGNPILRTTAKHLTIDEILSDDVQQTIKDMRYTVANKKYGVGLAAPQVGIPISVALIAIKPTLTRPDRQVFNRVIINPKILKTYGNRKRMWESCISFGTGPNTPYGETYRYKNIDVQYFDENGREIVEHLTGLPAHVFQHELDHLNGVLFVDRLTSPKTLVCGSEFRKRILPILKKEKAPDGD